VEDVVEPIQQNYDNGQTGNGDVAENQLLLTNGN